jgi:hypothetical protein
MAVCKASTSREILTAVQSFLDSVLQDDERERAFRTEPATDEERADNLRGLDIVLSEVKEGLAISDYEWGQDIVNGVIKKFQLDIEENSDTHRLLSREILKAIARAIPIQMDRWNGQYDGDPIVANVKPSTNPAVETLQAKVRGAGRPSGNWDAIKDELIRMENDGELPVIKHGWKITVCRTLANWHNGKFPNTESVEGKSITTKPLIKFELDRIDRDHKSQTP